MNSGTLLSSLGHASIPICALNNLQGSGVGIWTDQASSLSSGLSLVRKVYHCGEEVSWNYKIPILRQFGWGYKILSWAILSKVGVRGSKSEGQSSWFGFYVKKDVFWGIEILSFEYRAWFGC